MPKPYEALAGIGQALLDKTRADYKTAEGEFRDLIAFNDRYTGVETLERAQAAYREAFQHDNLAEMIQARAAVLYELDRARARKQLLTQQSAQITGYEHTLSDDAASIDREGLAKFMDPRTPAALGELRNMLRQLSQTSPAKRGDISANLEILATRIQNLDAAIRSGRSVKAKAEQTRQMLLEREGAAQRVLETALTEELKAAFDADFVKSTEELITRFGELASTDLSVLRERQEDIDAATRKLADLQTQASGAQAQYERDRQIQALRQAIVERTRELPSLKTDEAGISRFREIGREYRQMIDKAPIVVKGSLTTEMDGFVRLYAEYENPMGKAESELQNKRLEAKRAGLTCEGSAPAAAKAIFDSFLAYRGRADLVAKLPSELSNALFKVDEVATDYRLGSVLYCTATFRPFGVFGGPNKDSNQSEPKPPKFDDSLKDDPTAGTVIAAVLIQISALPPLRGQYRVRVLDDGNLIAEFAPGALNPR